LVPFDHGNLEPASTLFPSLLIFRFQARVMNNIEGEIQKIDDNTQRVLMTEAFEEDCITDIRFRMGLTITPISLKLAEEIKGTRAFFVKDSLGKWVQVRDHDRIVQFLQY
jgi:hypothetical protein